MNKLPKEILLKIICEKSWINYLSTEECHELIRKLNDKILDNVGKQLKEFLPLSAEDYEYIDFIELAKYSYGGYIELTVRLSRPSSPDELYFQWRVSLKEHSITTRDYSNSKALYVKNISEKVTTFFANSNPSGFLLNLMDRLDEIVIRTDQFKYFKK